MSNEIDRDKVIEILKIRMKANLEEAKDIFVTSNHFNMENEQFFINWQNDLNKISVAFETLNSITFEFIEND